MYIDVVVVISSAELSQIPTDADTYFGLFFIVVFFPYPERKHGRLTVWGWSLETEHNLFCIASCFTPLTPSEKDNSKYGTKVQMVVSHFKLPSLGK